MAINPCDLARWGSFKPYTQIPVRISSNRAARLGMKKEAKITQARTTKAIPTNLRMLFKIEAYSSCEVAGIVNHSLQFSLPVSNKDGLVPLPVLTKGADLRS